VRRPSGDAPATNYIKAKVPSSWKDPCGLLSGRFNPSVKGSYNNMGLLVRFRHDPSIKNRKSKKPWHTKSKGIGKLQNLEGQVPP
jgi:hypothetical protein